MQTLVLGGGCFWCLEAVYQQVKGVDKVVSGYAGGTTKNPTYENIGDHAEVIQITYDPSLITLATLLEIFFAIHDPTTLNRQGNDEGEQYRSIILCAENELDVVRASRDIAQKNWQDPIVTEIETLDTFYPAENYHQNYYQNNQSAGYCQIIINPKLDKFKENFKHILK
ncbi:MAG TPA: peptide-methionine (S)-S-oxide reductase MsrA [Candidatus Saccharibacteria bacterium]|jgi:methionine-S-sulfoxide reductase|nr:peptide-methionine (S)-S-oxide reductase MsrA [Candidatus Saccharibacteria bacterium]HMT55718.1 peptide-methionine (S)-S-oxide reductase MsrA [Candidatus Saccharibacteria bacterium]